MTNALGETRAEYTERRMNERGVEIGRLKDLLALALNCLSDESPAYRSRKVRTAAMEKIALAIVT
jgi:hypothetical protein